MLSLRTAAVAVGLCTSLPSPASAQIDHRNLDDDRPVVTEDAYDACTHGAHVSDDGPARAHDA